MPSPTPLRRLATAALALAAGQAAGQGAPSGLSFGSTAPGAEAGAQGAAPQVGRLLVIDRERVLAESRRGRALLAELDADGLALAEENRGIEARLRDEERVLTERRPGMEPEAFRAEADAFDARVQEIRQAQEAKRREVLSRRDAIQDRIEDELLPVLGAIVQERGAAVVLDRALVFLVSDSVDITGEAIVRLDAAGAGPPADPAGGDAPGPAGGGAGAPASE